MRCFVISDIHSFYYEMISALNVSGFEKDNPQHVLICLGDLLDRGPDPKKCLEFINSLPRKILIRGNHEDLLQEAIQRKGFLSHDFSNKTFETVQKVTGIKSFNEKSDAIMLESFSNNKLWKTYINSCIDYAETDKYIFTHGWIPVGDDWRNGDWSSARWTNGMQSWKDGLVVNDKTILCGHWHTSWGHHFIDNKCPEWDMDIWFDKNSRADFSTFKKKGIIALDACTAVSKFCNCEVLNIPRKQLEGYL